ncbi:hypothetical protein [Tautonia marina]|uniref:hypothetical protein n=1 Tax=Tautonia marina TaxID=2653855 RepID=UPI001260B599|nr:hypothetical protein [Tautonia marina]
MAAQGNPTPARQDTGAGERPPGIRETLREGPVSQAIGAVTSEPYLRAAFRQGIDELSETLKAFPDSIQKSEIGGLFTPTPAEVAQEHGIFGPSIEQSEGLAMVQHNPVAAVLEASRPGPPEAEKPRNQEPERGPTGDRSAPEAEARNPVAEALEVSRAEPLTPQATPMDLSQDQDLGRGR